MIPREPPLFNQRRPAARAITIQDANTEEIVIIKRIDIEKLHELLDVWENLLEEKPEECGIISSNTVFKKCYNTIKKTITTLQELDFSNIQENHKEFHYASIFNIYSAIQTYFNVIRKITSLPHNEIPAAVNIESELFIMSFSFKENTYGDLHYSSTIFPVFLKQEEFLSLSDKYVILDSSTGSGKTRCIPFIFAIRSFFDKCRFFIMTQPSTSIANDRARDLRKFLNDDVIIETTIDNMLELYKNEEEISKPVIGIFSPLFLLKLLAKAKEENINVFDITRFCLDEIHERHVETDATLVILRENVGNAKPQGAHMILMSATPDTKVNDIFRYKKIVKVTDKALFNVYIDNKVISDINEAPQAVSNGVFSLITDFKNNKMKQGHILCFLPGNKMIRAVSREIFLKYRYDPYFAIFKYDFEDTTTFKEVIDALKDFTYKNNDKIVLFPIKLAGYSNFIEKKIAKNILPDKLEQKVIKVIYATNAVESSITIVNVAAVVDSGLHNSPLFDDERGITRLNVKPITKKMQNQRKGRVGRTRSGKVIQITMDGEELPENIPPEIITNDISFSIMNLRTLGIKLEELKRLPDNPGKKKFLKTIEELKGLKVLDDEGNITDFGKEVALLNKISPLYGAAIIHTAEKYDKFDKNVVKCIGSLVVLIMMSNKLVIEPTSKYLQKNFCQDSDIVTIIKTFSECIKEKTTSFDYVIDYGFLKSEFVSIYEQIEGTFFSFTGRKIQEFWDELNAFFEENDIIEFINTIILEVAKGKPKWIQAHSVDFSTLKTIPYGARIVYTGNFSLSDTIQHKQNVYVEERPGNKGYATPRKVIVCNISTNEQDNNSYGTIVHCMNKDNDIGGIPSMIVSSKMVYLSDFFSVILNAYFDESYENSLVKLETTKNEGLKYFQVSKWEDKAIITFIPLESGIIREIRKACDKIIKLMPFVAKSILVEDYKEKYIVEAYTNGSDIYNSEVYSLENEDSLPRGFNITSETVDFLVSKKLNELASKDNKYRIAMTADSMVYQIDTHDLLSESKIITASRNCNTVFGGNDVDNNRIVLLVSKGEEMPPGETLSWNHRVKEIDTENIHYMIKKLNDVCPSIVRANYKLDAVCFRSTNSFVFNEHNFTISSLPSILKNIAGIMRDHPNEKIYGAHFKYSPVKKENKNLIFRNFDRLFETPHTISTDFLTTSIELELPIKDEERDQMISNIVTIAEECNFDFAEFDVIPVVTISIVHQKSLLLDVKQFIKKVKNIKEKYEALFKYVDWKHPYKDEKDRNSPIRGTIDIEVYSPHIALIIAEAIKKEFKKDIIALNVPQKTIPHVIFRMKETKNAIIDWCRELGLRTIRLDPTEGIVGSANEVTQALNLLNDEEHKIELPFSFIKVPKSKKSLDVISIINETEGTSNWDFSSSTHILILPTSDVERAKEILEIENSENEDLIGCLDLCDEVSKSISYVSVYRNNGQIKTKPLCMHCVMASLEDATIGLITEDEEIDFNAIKSTVMKPRHIPIEAEEVIDNQIWPKCPLGQLFWVLTNDVRTQKYARVWLTTVAYHTARTDKNVFIFCPDHPEKFLPAPKSDDDVVKCCKHDCPYWYCTKCKTWHNTEKCTEEILKKHCPKCGFATEKTGGCNHITCPHCQCHWCYICEIAFDTSDDCYQHLLKVHGNYFDPGTPEFNDFGLNFL